MKKYKKRRNLFEIPIPVPFPHTVYKTCRPNSVPPEKVWDDLVNFLAREYLDPSSFRWVFRGVSKESYRLKSKLERELESSKNWREQLEKELKSSGKKITRGWTEKLKRVNRQEAEIYLLSQFKRAAHHFVEPSIVPTNDLEWLALMQHYGTPTRLLDFTRSPYVACYFALEEVKESDTNRECAIWAIDANWLSRITFRRIRSIIGKGKFTFRDILGSKFIQEHFNDFYDNDSASAILPIFTPRLNVRLLVQQGLFLCPSATKETFEEILSSYKNDTKSMEKHVHKIVIEGRLRHEVLAELHSMNISRTSLFPGLEGFATSLKHEMYYKSSSELTTLS